MLVKDGLQQAQTPVSREFVTYMYSQTCFSDHLFTKTTFYVSL